MSRTDCAHLPSAWLSPAHVFCGGVGLQGAWLPAPRVLRGSYALAGAFLALFIVRAADAGPLRYLAARDVLFDYRAGNGVPVEEAQLWVSADGRRSWQRVADAATGQHTLHFLAPADGTFDFYIVLQNAGGASAPPPAAGSAATVTVLVDTLPPLLQVHAVRVGPPSVPARLAAAAQSAGAAAPDAANAAAQLAIVFDLTLVEEHLSESALRVFFQSGTGDWHDGGPVHLDGDGATWVAPAEVRGPMNLRLIATDLAGNRAQEDLRAVEIVSAPANEPTENAAASELNSSQLTATGQRDSDRATTAPAARDPEPGAVAEAQRLRSLATHFMNAGHYSLAAARYEDALAATPGDADLLAELGRALVRLDRPADADRRFRAALDAAPNHVDALDGLALVAATQRRYPEAREYLVRLQQLQPGVGSVWLRSGDIEHRLGRRSQALEDWQRAQACAGSDQELRDKAARRLAYFGPQKTEPAADAAANALWPEPPNRPRSSSSAGTTTTRNPPR